MVGKKKPEKQRVRSTHVSRGLVSVSVSSRSKTSRKGAKTQRPTADFSPTLGDIDLHLFGEGKHLRIYDKLGAHVMTH